MRNTATIVAAWNILSVSVIGEGIQVSYQFKPKGGDSTGEGSSDPSSQGDQAECTHGGDA